MVVISSVVIFANIYRTYFNFLFQKGYDSVAGERGINQQQIASS